MLMRVNRTPRAAVPPGLGHSHVGQGIQLHGHHDRDADREEICAQLGVCGSA
jgi:hypothetical protein